MTVLGHNSYGKAEVRLLRVDRGSDRDEITDLNVSVALAGDLDATHLTGDNANVLPTDTQKNTVYAFARDGVGSPEAFGLRLARHFVDSQPSIGAARVSIQQYHWTRLRPHSFARHGGTVRSAAVTYDGTGAWVVSGVTDLVLLNTTDSEFHGFVVDRYTTLRPATDRILATSVDATWRYALADADWDRLHEGASRALVDAFADTYSYSLQQTLYAMGQAVLDRVPEVTEVRLSLPNRHHFLVDLTPYGLENPGEVFNPDDRPYGLIEGTVLRPDSPPAGLAWSLRPGG
ncbi:MAG TPA: urate oxidase [Micromonosporaceae bacterium]|jgi:urate oxidase